MNFLYGECIVVCGVYGLCCCWLEGEGEEDGIVFECVSCVMGVLCDDGCCLMCELCQFELLLFVDFEEEVVVNEFVQVFVGMFKCEFVGWKVFVFIGDFLMLWWMWLKEFQCILFYNGNIECCLFCFDMVKGGMCDCFEWFVQDGILNDNVDV